MKRYALALTLFMTGCGSTSTTIVVADKPTPGQRYGNPEIRLEFKINEAGGRRDTHYRGRHDRD